ncbi:MAG TPA: hypothetical protein VF528_08705 [Pyrinomonadaceae bacterium]|jgi:hypothetical protein
MRQHERPESKHKEQAVLGGLEFLYRTACDAGSFESYGYDLLFCFHCISSTSQSVKLRKTARRMGRERARHWRREHKLVPPDVNAEEVFQLVFGSLAADCLGVCDPSLKPQLRRAARCFTARDYFWFEPTLESPPENVPEYCACGADNPRGRLRCRGCRKGLKMLGRYGVWIDALIASYVGERYGVRLGASYRDVITWLPFMRPYRGYDGGKNHEFYWTAYAVTHVVYTLNGYSAYSLFPRWLPDEFAYLCGHLKELIALKDPETAGEFLDNLKSFGLNDDDALISSGTEFVLSAQNADGSWGDVKSEDIYERYHSTYTALNGIRDYAPRPQGLCFPKLLPLLKRCAGSKPLS